MSYTNSWWPGATYTAFGLSAGAGVLGLYALAYSLLGVTAMYLMAERAWVWGKRFDQRTQCDMLGMRFDSKAVRVIASLIGIICRFLAGPGHPGHGRAVPFRQFRHLERGRQPGRGRGPDRRATDLTVQMGMRGLVITDLVQGIVANGGSALLCLGLLWFSREAYANLATLPSELLRLPGQGGQYGVWYVSSLILTGVIGSLCWPTSYQRIYTASGVGAVKKGTVQTMIVAGGFYALLTLVALAASGLTWSAPSRRTAGSRCCTTWAANGCWAWPSSSCWPPAWAGWTAACRSAGRRSPTTSCRWCRRARTGR